VCWLGTIYTGPDQLFSFHSHLFSG